MFTQNNARRLFGEMLRQPDDRISLVEAALLLAAACGQTVEPELSMAQFSAMATRAGELLLLQGIATPADSPHDVFQAISRVVFEEEGFKANREDYYDPSNSYLNLVLDRKTGIPITLSIVYMEVARLLGVSMHGIGLPGHFVAGYWDPQHPKAPMLIIDAYEGGRFLSTEECAERVHATYGNEVQFTLEWLEPVSNRKILVRVLNNLKHAHMSAQNYREALSAIDLLLLVQPDGVWELKDRGMLYYRTGVFELALADLKKYLRVAPEGEDTGLVKYYVDLLNRLIESRN